MRVVVLTGAGISAESGVPTFRDADGLWEGHPRRGRGDPAGLRRRPRDRPPLLRRAPRRAGGRRAQPGARRPRRARARPRPTNLLLVTQNIDDLHERGGSTAVLHMHGRLLSALCAECGARCPWEGPMIDAGPCALCGVAALRPDVVWFGEVPLGMDRIQAALERAEVFCSIGTSGAVYPAAGFVQYARGARRGDGRAQPRALRGHPPLRRRPPRPRLAAGARLGRRGPLGGTRMSTTTRSARRSR